MMKAAEIGCWIGVPVGYLISVAAGLDQPWQGLIFTVPWSMIWTVAALPKRSS